MLECESFEKSRLAINRFWGVSFLPIKQHFEHVWPPSRNLAFTYLYSERRKYRNFSQGPVKTSKWTKFAKCLSSIFFFDFWDPSANDYWPVNRNVNSISNPETNQVFRQITLINNDVIIWNFAKIFFIIFDTKFKKATF